MSVLKSLTLVAAKPAKVTSPKDRGREKIVAFLNEQRSLVTALLEGTSFAPTKTVFRNDEAGNRVKSEAPRRVRQAWFKDAAGALFFQVRYGAKPLELAKGMTAIQVEKLDALPALIDTLKQAVTAGELDAVLSVAAADRRKNFKRTKPAATA